MILITININGTDYYVSDELLALTHSWMPYVDSFTSPQYQLATEYGGWSRLGFGSISFSPDLFVSDWPPPRIATATVQYTATTEAVAITLFSCDLRLHSFGQTSVDYEMYEHVYPQNILDIGPDYNGDTVPYPRAFGAVTHVEPLRIADNVGGEPTYHTGGLISTVGGVGIASLTSASGGSSIDVTTKIAHGYANGDTVVIVGTVNLNGSYTIGSISTYTFRITAPFPTDGSETLPLHAVAYKAGNLTVYDDGVPIPENVTFNGDNTFSLSASPVGVVTMSGTSQYTDLDTVITWCQTRLEITSINTTNSRSSSPSVSCWITDQQVLTEFMSDICAFFTHLYYIRDDTVWLIDMFADNGVGNISEYEYFSASYSIPTMIGQITASWMTYKSAEEIVDEVRSAQYVKTIENNAVASLYQLASGTATGTTPNKLVDTGATFLTDGVKIGDIAQNTSDNTSASIIAVLEAELTLDSDIFVSAEDYVVGPAMPYANDINVTPFHDTRSNIMVALQNILKIVNEDAISIKVPISDDLPMPGRKITFGDTSLKVDTSTYFYTRNLTFDFLNDEMMLDGEGVIS